MVAQKTAKNFRGLLFAAPCKRSKTFSQFFLWRSGPLIWPT